MITFVILHYKNIKDTIECIQSILNLKSNKNVSIVVVDNKSLTRKDEMEILKYTKDIIKLQENLGFAKGNNEGCKYAIKKYNPDFLCVINNDTVIFQKDFIKEIYDAFQKTKFDIMGPKILSNSADSVNPFHTYQTIKEIEEKINYSEKLVRIYKSVLLRNLLKVYIFVKHIFIKRKKLLNGEKSKLGVALHGCALIFSKKYYKKYQDVFYSGTFLYHEEEFLDYRRRKDKLITYYDANLEIFHKEGSSLNESFSNNYDKLIFRNQEIIKSLKLLKEVYKEGGIDE